MLDQQLQRPKQQVGLYLAADGIAVAEITCKGEAPPELKFCEFISASDPAEQLKQLSKHIKKHDLKNIPCVVVLEDTQYNLFQMPHPPVEEAELKSALRWSIRDLISYPVEQAVVDVFRVPVQQNREAKIYVVVTPKDEIQKTVNFIRKTGLSLTSIDIEELSLGNLVEQMQGQARGIAVIHFGQQQGSINLYSDSALYLSRKIDAGLMSMESAQSQAAIEQMYESIILELQRSLDFYESEYARAPISKLIVAPRHPMLQGFCDYVSQQSGLTIELMNLAQIYSETTELNDENQARCLLAIAAASRKVTVAA
jgi:MSHA biogenesis protein MshI